MKLRWIIVIGLAIRVGIAPFVAHPLDVYAWFEYGRNLVTEKDSLWSYLVPYNYSFFLFVIPATLLYDFFSQYIPTFTLQMSSLNPILNPGPVWNITLVPGLLFDLLVKIVLIVSDSLVALFLYKIVFKFVGIEKLALSVAAIWFLNPFTIWVSAGWGTFDTLPALLTIISMYFLLEKKSELAVIFVVLAISMKYYAVVLIVPILILSFVTGGRGRFSRTLFCLCISSAILFLPYFHGVLAATNYTLGGSSTQLHYSGLSVWTAVTLYSTFNETPVAYFLVVVALCASYFWIWKNRHSANSMRLIFISFFLPIASLLLFYRFVGENFFIWILPFVTILSLGDKWTSHAYWSISLVALISSFTDGLLPFFLLPLSPWIGNLLVHMLAVIAPYRVAPSGNVVLGLTIGKILLTIYGVLAFFLVSFVMIHSVSQRNDLSGPTPIDAIPVS